MGKNRLILPVIAVFLFLVVSMVSAFNPYEWNKYGSGSLTTINMAQDPQAVGSINSSALSINSTFGQNYQDDGTAHQSLVTQFNTNNQSFIVFPNNNFLQVYDKNLNLYGEIFTNGSAVGQIDIGDFNHDNLTNDVAGIWETASNIATFKVYTFNPNTHAFSSIFQENVTMAGFSTTGVRCISGANERCFSYLTNSSGGTNSIKFFIFYTNQSHSRGDVVTTSTQLPLEPPNFIDADLNGVLDFALATNEKAGIHSETTNFTLFQSAVSVSTNDAGIKYTRWVQADGSSTYKLIVGEQFTGTPSCTTNVRCSKISAYRTDTSSYWTPVQIINATDGTFALTEIQGIAIRDYDGDGFDDIWVTASTATIDGNLRTGKTEFKILKGSSGAVLFGALSPLNITGNYPLSMLTIGRADSDSVFDFVASDANNTVVYSSNLNSTLFKTSTTVRNVTNNCVIADASFDTYNDIICSGKAGSRIYTNNNTNTNPTITSVSYNPSTSISTGTNLIVTITANDADSDSILYSIKCSNADSYGAEDGSNVKSCTYNSEGTFNNTVGVRDIFHGFKTEFSQLIVVSNSTSPPVSNNGTSTTASGGITLPTELVSTTNTNTGLFPEIYYGLLAFFSNILSPLIVIVIVFLFVMSFIAVIAFVRVIVNKVGH